jgi:hypothetical protein
MRAGGSKGKGSSFEREICIALSKWVTKGEKVDCFWRSAMSGGRATVAKGLVRQAGDITAVAPEGHKLTDDFYIECKFYKNLSLDCLIKGKGTLLDMWNDTECKAMVYGRTPILIFKQNHWPTVLATNSAGVISFNLKKILLLSASTMHLVKLDTLLDIPFPL